MIDKKTSTIKLIDPEINLSDKARNNDDTLYEKQIPKTVIDNETNDKIYADLNSTKNKFQKILDKKWINNVNVSEIINISEIDLALNSLCRFWKISKEEYISISVELWIAKLWQILINRKLITEDQLKIAMVIQNNLSQSLKIKPIWEILCEMGIINFEKLAEVLEDLKIIRSWEFVTHKSWLNYEDLKNVLDIQVFIKESVIELLIREHPKKKYDILEALKDYGKIRLWEYLVLKKRIDYSRLNILLFWYRKELKKIKDEKEKSFWKYLIEEGVIENQVELNNFLKEIDNEWFWENIKEHELWIIDGEKKTQADINCAWFWV